MTTFNFRSLLLAAIVLSNCITWTASRHHYAHNVHQHRTRHRRQGAGLYLPASYVIPGGEGGGPWGEWGEVSPCSRTCGGGVASQKRICLQPERMQCTGGDTKYFSCQTQDCPEGSGDFRAEQCAEFNDKAFRGFKYNWVPYTKAPNPCELNCMPHGERFYFRQKEQVTDGTRCNDDSFDVCVKGTCQPVGCDMMLNSTAREDKCRECRGNGANCRTTEGIFDSQDFIKGYNDILLIPAGSTSIYIEEVEPSNNYLALRAKDNGTYYLNGHYHIDFPRTIMIAGALWTYERSQNGFAAPDKLRCLGPTNEPLYLSVLIQDDNVGIKYEYSVPNNSAPPTDKQYNWVHEEFTPCSATCGGGFQTRNVTCRSRDELEEVDASLCDEGLKPPTNQSCNPDPCPAQWVEGSWGECSQRCGSGGVKSREVTCQKIIANGIKSIVPDKECFDLLGPKPEVFQKCNEDAPCPTWFVGHWRPCDQLCDEGKQTRQVVCHEKKNGRIEVLGDGNCTEAKPEEEMPCMVRPCDGVDWVTTSWSGCDSCTSKNRTRLVVCSTKGRQVVNDSFCSHHNRPIDNEECKKDELPDCEVQWYASQWSKCSVICGDGVQTRKVFCGMYYDDANGGGVEVVEDAKCANLTKYNDTKPCTVPKEKCPSQWFAGPWTACTATCGGGEQYRRVMCYRGDQEAVCDGASVLDPTRLCNTQPCGEFLPVSRTSTVVMEDEEEYCDELTSDAYEEVGLDLTADGMISDSPDIEAETTLSIADDWITEGSGFTTTDLDNTTDSETGSTESLPTTNVPSKDMDKTTKTTVIPPTKSYAELESTMDTGSGYGSSLSTAEDLITEGSGFSTTDYDYTSDNDTGSGETSLTTDVPSSAASKDTDKTTRTTVIPPTKSSAVTTISPETDKFNANAEETVSTPTNITEDTEATSSSNFTGSTESITNETTESTPTADTNSTSSDITSTSSNETTETEVSGPTTVGEVGSTESNVTKELGSTSESGSTSSGVTGSSDTEGTGLTTEANTPFNSTGSTELITTDTTESTPTADFNSTSTDTSSTSSNETTETGASGPTTVGEIGSTEFNITKDIGSTNESGSTSSGETGSSDTDGTGLTTVATTPLNSTGSTESITTEKTETTPTADTNSTSSDTGSTSSGETGSTDTDATGLTTVATTPLNSTGSTESITTDTMESTPTADTNSTSSDTSSTSSNETTETEASEPTTVGEVGSTESNVTKETGSTSESGSTSSGETGSSDTDGTGLTTEANTSFNSTGSTESITTDKTESTPTPDTNSTSSDTSSTSSNETTETEASGPTTVGEIGSTESNVTKETGSTSESGSTSSGETGSSDTDGTGLTTVATTPSITTKKTESTPTADTNSTISNTGSTSSNETTETGASGPTTVVEVGSTESNATKETGSTSESGSTSSGETGSSDTDGTGLTTEATTPLNSTGSTESITTEKTESTPTADTNSTISDTGSTSSNETTETETSGPTTVGEIGSTESNVTTEIGSTSESGSTSSGETTPTNETGSTDTDEPETVSTNSTVTVETGSTEPTVTEKTESTVTNDTESTGTEKSTGTENLTSIGSTDSTTTTRAVPTDSTTTTRAVPTGSTTTTRAVPTESKKDETTTPSSTGSSEVSESSTSSFESTDKTSTSSEVESTGSESTSTAAESNTTTESDKTTESGSTISGKLTTESAEARTLGTSSSTPSETESTTTAAESSSSVAESTVTESSTSSGTESVGSESTTESETSTGESSTVSGEITTGTESTEENTTASGSTTGSEESTMSTYSTTEGTTITGSTEVSGSTTTELSTTEGSTGTTIWTKSTVFVTPKRVCKPRWKPMPSLCNETTFGCCPDQKSPASGPFDEGCDKPHTCKNSTHGCCPDGLSPAQGENNEGCPREPCADTLFGCCSSDNTTAAQGNDQDGCPPICASSKYGCCADNDTEATGPGKEGCPETSTTGAPTDTTTETTESVETSEGSTTKESTTDVISTTTLEISTTTLDIGTTTLDPCSGFKFGCCADNETEASGPDGQGCPCNATEFGCCPDGVSPASGLENEGCPGPCSTSPHGCCQDDKTPAHGPDFEGCCLLQAFGCCPDNRKPAEGPHFEGCGCQNALHGCCPDNVTAAQGADNQGCGCQYTQHGCCPDRHTPATGPNNEGCACNTYQFGCCADGVTTATGPEQQGCHCRESKFGCCGDGETHATGPDAAGCDCSSSRHGCCPDGRTEATGPKFLGCTDAPKNKQAACSMSTDPGPCHNFTAMWYYDLAYGGCSRFWYGGCDGNGNRFMTKEECEDVCVQPSPKDACKLPSVKGACDADYQRWHYNSTREQCIPFRYGGCLGNANNFDTRELCQKQCEPSSVSGQCNLPIDQGSCAGNYSRWGFNSEAHRCEQFIWGGCEGNSNRFRSEAACQMRCAGTQPPQCTQPQEAGNCTEKEALWSFSQSENRCLPFYYSGCGGNDNQFRSRETCEQTCPSAYVPDKCTLPAETGQCSNYREKWFYDTAYKRCRLFYYGGCGGNENKFDSEAECENSCSEIKTTTTTATITTTTTTSTTTTTTAKPVEPKPQPGPVEAEQKPATPERSEFCFNAIDAGPCNNIETRYAYDSELGRCVTFQYGGCGGNQNNFPDEDYCSYYCQPMQDICQLPMLQGPCEDSLMRWFYDPTTDSCSQFTYGGCEGNDNRFESLEACENRCRTGPAPVETTTPSTTVIVDAPSECRVPEALEDCHHGGEVWYFDPSRHECVSHANQEAGPACRYTGTFLSQEACERSCGAFRGVDVCKQSKDPGPCQTFVTKVYFDSSTGQCHEFIYGGCLGGANRFSSIEECSQVCKAEIADPCTLPPEGGNCFSYIQQWYYDPSRDQCNQFVFTGCSGNENRFETQRDCEARCKRPAMTTTTTVAPPPQQREEEECRTPSSLAPCGNNVTVFYYDSERRECLISGFGGCEHPNTYRTEEECERTCGAFRGMDVCGARLDPGPCRASFDKIYWDASSGSCQPYAYGGCGGGPNRFSSVEECLSICGDTGPARECLQEVDTGHSCEEIPTPRYHYSVAHVDCVVFAYLGCGGNDNNFHSYAHCADVCRVSRRDDPNGVLTRDCTPYSQECEALAGCQYGIDRFTQDGCQRCQCREDPCVRANCQSNERCEVIASRNAATQEPMYSARCVAERNEVYDCDEYVANCSRLRCEYGIKRARLPDGCEKCSCRQNEIDCESFKQQCDKLKCDYGTERVTGSDGCERCKCKEYPCGRKSCGAGERCVVLSYMNGLDPEPKYTAECRIIVKAGACPMDETTTNEVECHHTCRDDADCRGVGKCCRRGCSDICVVPVEQTSPHPLLTTTVAPNIPAAPQALPQQKPEVAASEGGTATLRCLFHGNPPPRITWRFGEVTIDDNVGRYRLMSDGALEIVSLYRNDTGVYICVADNGLGVATQEVHLAVNDPVTLPVGIAGDENAVVTGELGRPLHVRCLAYGYPPPSVYWYRGYESAMVPYNDAVYEARGNVLLIRSLAPETLGQYTCQAYNGEGKPASWVVFVQAYTPREGPFIDNELLVPRNPVVPRPRTQRPTTAETTTTTTSTTTEAPRPFNVPVSTHVSWPSPTLNIGADLHLTCEVDGFPEPDVYWTKDGNTLQRDGRITITGSTIVSRLTVMRVTVADSGLYACHASNPYSSQSDTAQINVQQITVPAKCTDNPFFANCDLIVRSKFCRHKYYTTFCCKSCVEAGQLDPQEVELQADQPFRKK